MQKKFYELGLNCVCLHLTKSNLNLLRWRKKTFLRKSQKLNLYFNCYENPPGVKTTTLIIQSKMPTKIVLLYLARVTRRCRKICPNFWKSSQNNWKTKISQNIFIKVQFLSPKHLQQNPSEHLKYIQQTKFWLWLVAKIVKYRPIWSPCT